MEEGVLGEQMHHLKILKINAVLLDLFDMINNTLTEEKKKGLTSTLEKTGIIF